MDEAWSEMPLLDRMVAAVERVQDRLRRTTAALEAAGVAYAVVGDNAVSAWVATIDPSAVRNAKYVQVLLRRADLTAAERALTVAGFVRCQVGGAEMFLDGPDGRPDDAVRVVMAGEKPRPDCLAPAPDVTESVRLESFHVILLETLVQMQLASYRTVDMMYLRDMLDLGLIDTSWPARFPPDLAARLQLLIDTPE